MDIPEMVTVNAEEPECVITIPTTTTPNPKDRNAGLIQVIDRNRAIFFPGNLRETALVCAMP